MNTRNTNVDESFITQSICRQLEEAGCAVATEVANFHRSADIAAVGPNGEVIVVECKVSDMKRAVAQSITHRLSADRVMVATCRRVLKPSTISLIHGKGVGLYFVDSTGAVEVAWQPTIREAAWPLRREQLRRRILEGNKT
jgi:hypothetical protein